MRFEPSAFHSDHLYLTREDIARLLEGATLTQGALVVQMEAEPFAGIVVSTDPSVPKNEVWLEQGGRVVLKISGVV